MPTAGHAALLKKQNGYLEDLSRALEQARGGRINRYRRLIQKLGRKCRRAGAVLRDRSQI